MSSPVVLPATVPGDATQLCWTKTFGNMRKDANDADDTDEVGRTRVHVGPKGDCVDQAIAVQTGHTTAKQVANSSLVKTRGRSVVSSEMPNGAGLHMASSTGVSE